MDLGVEVGQEEHPGGLVRDCPDELQAVGSGLGPGRALALQSCRGQPARGPGGSWKGKHRDLGLLPAAWLGRRPGRGRREALFQVSGLGFVGEEAEAVWGCALSGDIPQGDVLPPCPPTPIFFGQSWANHGAPAAEGPGVRGRALGVGTDPRSARCAGRLGEWTECVSLREPQSRAGTENSINQARVLMQKHLVVSSTLQFKN